MSLILRVEKHFQDTVCLASCHATCQLGCRFPSSGRVIRGTGTQVLACTQMLRPLSHFSSPLFLGPSVSALVGWGRFDLFPKGACTAHSSNGQASTRADGILGEKDSSKFTIELCWCRHRTMVQGELCIEHLKSPWVITQGKEPQGEERKD